jgi:hypothetical protein
MYQRLDEIQLTQEQMSKSGGKTFTIANYLWLLN